MKVLHLISGNDNGGGAAHVMNISQAPFYESIIGCIGEGVFAGNLAAKEVPYVIFPKLKNLRKIHEFIVNNNIEVVNFHGAQAFMIHRLIRRRLKGVKTAATVHSDYRYDFKNNILKYILFTPISILGLKSIRNFICVSQSLKELLDCKNFKGNKFVVYNGAYKDKQISCSREELRREHNIPQDAFVLCVAARFHPVKNHTGLIEAYEKFSKKHEDAHLFLIGDGPLMSKIHELTGEKGLSKQVTFTGYKGNVSDYFNCADVNVLVSLSEGGMPPLTVLEGAYMGKTAIVSDVSDMKIMKDYVFLVEPTDIESIVTAMEDAYKSFKEGSLKNKGQAFCEYCSDKFTIENMQKTYFEVYGQIQLD